MIFVDDACPAGSGAVLDQLARGDARVRVIRHERNQGQRLAVWHGLEAARGEIVITMDADLQDPPEAIPPLLLGGAAGKRRGGSVRRTARRVPGSSAYGYVAPLSKGSAGDDRDSGGCGRVCGDDAGGAESHSADRDGFAVSARAAGVHRTAGVLGAGGAGGAARGKVGLFGVGAVATGVLRLECGVEVEAARVRCGRCAPPSRQCLQRGDGEDAEEAQRRHKQDRRDRAR